MARSTRKSSRPAPRKRSATVSGSGTVARWCSPSPTSRSPSTPSPASSATRSAAETRFSSTARSPRSTRPNSSAMTNSSRSGRSSGSSRRMRWGRGSKASGDVANGDWISLPLFTIRDSPLAHSRKQPPRLLRLHHPLDPDRHRRGAIGDTVALGAGDDHGPAAFERALEPVHHLVLRPEILLQVLHPFEIADDDAARVAQDVGDDEDPVV